MSWQLPATGDVVLGGVTLCDNLLLRGLRAPRVAVDAWRTKGGRAGVLVQSLPGGRQLELYGHYTTAQADALQALEGQEVTLVHPRGTFSGRVTGNDLAPLWEYTDADQTDIEIGTIYFLET